MKGWTRYLGLALVNGGAPLAIHLCILFNLFLQFHYLPHGFMQSEIIPTVKSKAGNLTDVNNYRAITISTSMSKLFEAVIADEVCSYSEYDCYQFGFKTGHSTMVCVQTF